MVVNGEVDMAWDEVSGNALIFEECGEARQVVMDYFERMVVFTRVDRSHQQQTQGNIISTRWLAVNRG